MKRRLVRESISEEQQEQYLEMFTSIPADERKRIKKAIKECLKENGFSVGFLGGYALIGIMVLVIGIKFKAIDTITAGFVMLASGGITLGTIQRKQLLQCAARKLGMDLGEMLNKMRGGEESPEMLPESKKVVKLTESELVELVQRIIKEDEMSLKGFTIAGLYKKSSYTQPLPQRLVISQIKGKIKVDGINKTSGSISITSKIECLGDCEIMFKDVQGLGEVSITVKNGVPKLFVTYE